MEQIPAYPPTVWALVEQGAERWSDHVLLADDHGRSLPQPVVERVMGGNLKELLALGTTGRPATR